MKYLVALTRDKFGEDPSLHFLPYHVDKEERMCLDFRDFYDSAARVMEDLFDMGAREQVFYVSDMEEEMPCLGHSFSFTHDRYEDWNADDSADYITPFGIKFALCKEALLTLFDGVPAVIYYEQAPAEVTKVTLDKVYAM